MVRIAGKAASVVFDHVTKVYPGGTTPAVDDVCFEIAAGTLVTLLGPSGCGKTTTLRMIAGLEMPTSGRVLIGGADVTRLPATDRDVSMVFQSYALFPHMTVMENVSYGLHFSGYDKRETAARAADGLALVGLSGFEARFPSELSGGQQQRVAVARALVLEPQVLLFDEPLSNLDAKLRRRVRDEIRDLQQELGLTVVYVTHDQTEALAVSDRIIVMDRAVIAQEGAPRELYDTPATAFVADFIGESNILPVEVLSVQGDTAEVRVGSATLRLPARGHAPGETRLSVRPNRVALTSAAADALPGTVDKATYIGSHTELLVATEAGRLFLTIPDSARVPEVGSPVHLALDPAGSVLLLDPA
jgi:iron(III) transport system ATP-binding protein